MGKEYRKQTDIISANNLPSNALLIEDFEGPSVRWQSGGVGTPTLSVTTTEPYFGLAAMRGRTRDASAANGDLISAFRTVILNGKAKINTSFVVHNALISTEGAIQIYTFTIKQGNETIVFELSIDDVNNELSYLDEDNNTTLVSGIATPLFSDIWMRVEIQFNWKTQKYDFIKIGNNEIDLSTLLPYVSTTGGTRSDMVVSLLGLNDQGGGGVGVNIKWDMLAITTPD